MKELPYLRDLEKYRESPAYDEMKAVSTLLADYECESCKEKGHIHQCCTLPDIVKQIWEEDAIVSKKVKKVVNVNLNIGMSERLEKCR